MSKKYYDKSIHRMICGNTKKEEVVKAPKYFCSSCEKRCDNRCTFFHRPVVKDYNRCYYHSFYKPVAVVFKAPDNLEEIMEKEEQKIA